MCQLVFRSDAHALIDPILTCFVVTGILYNGNMSSKVLLTGAAAAIDQTNTALDGLFAAGVAPVDGKDAIVWLREVEVVRRRIDAAATKLVGVIDRDGMYVDDGHALAKVMAFSTRLSMRVSGPLRRLSLAGAALLLLMADGGISGDELACELAVDRMLTCCPELGTVSLACVRSGCGGTMVPDLDESRAACLRNASCEQLRAQGACDLATWETPMTCMPPCMVKVPKCQ